MILSSWMRRSSHSWEGVRDERARKKRKKSKKSKKSVSGNWSESHDFSIILLFLLQLVLC